jgi:hypothetical protein
MHISSIENAKLIQVNELMYLLSMTSTLQHSLNKRQTLCTKHQQISKPLGITQEEMCHERKYNKQMHFTKQKCPKYFTFFQTITTRGSVFEF